MRGGNTTDDEPLSMDLVQNRERVGTRASLPASVPSTLTVFALCAQAATDGRAPTLPLAVL
jgi:hypothetical protein